MEEWDGQDAERILEEVKALVADGKFQESYARAYVVCPWVIIAVDFLLCRGQRWTL